MLSAGRSFACGHRHTRGNPVWFGPDGKCRKQLVCGDSARFDTRAVKARAIKGQGYRGCRLDGRFHWSLGAPSTARVASSLHARGVGLCVERGDDAVWSCVVRRAQGWWPFDAEMRWCRAGAPAARYWGCSSNAAMMLGIASLSAAGGRKEGLRLLADGFQSGSPPTKAR
jgi:hypothetical protein